MKNQTYLISFLIIALTISCKGATRWPAITTQPETQSVTEGQVVQFAVGATGSDPLAYLWFRDAIAVRGAKGQLLSHRAKLSENGTRWGVVVYNRYGVAVSDWVELKVSAKSPSPTPTPSWTPTATPSPTSSGTPTPTATATPSPSPSATPEPTTTPSATSTPSPTASPSATAVVTAVGPHGIVYLLAKSFGDTKGFTNDAVDGVRLRTDWATLEPKEGERNWADIDRAVADAAKNKKQVGVSIAFGIATPDWLKAKTKALTVTEPKTGTMPALNDPIAIAAEKKFIADYGARYDGKIAYISMGGFGQIMESFYNVGTGTAEDIAAWTSAVDQLVPAYAEAFPNTAFLLTAAKPFKSAAGETALRAVVDKYATKYPGRFGVMDASLNAQSSIDYVPNGLVSQWSGTNPVGLQFLTNTTTGFGGHDNRGTLEESLQKAVDLKAHFVEAYAADMDDPANAALFKTYSAKLPK